jgi:pimeloyl-ACP methyl ester carboxylesterase
MKQNIRTDRTNPERTDAAPTLLLVHGSWHCGELWAAVQRSLNAAGVRSLAPTLAGHDPKDARRNVSHADYVASVLRVLDAQPEPVALVGHSFGGSVISRVAELRPERCRQLVYYSAFVPRDGERVADSLPKELIDFLDNAAAATPDGSCELPFELFWNAFANTADEATARELHSRLVPEPHKPIFEALSLPGSTRLAIPSVYISCRDDRAMPPGAFHPGQSSRLKAPKLIEIDGDHEVLLTAPNRLAEALLEAIEVGNAPQH